jgi:hypothetical protein
MTKPRKTNSFPGFCLLWLGARRLRKSNGHPNGSFSETALFDGIGKALQQLAPTSRRATASVVLEVFVRGAPIPSNMLRESS